MTESFRKLKAWQEGMALAVLVYEITRQFPREELFGLTSQMRRAAASVPSNIAEGTARKSNKEVLVFLRISVGSLRELETQLQLSRLVGHITEELAAKAQLQIDSVGRLLTLFIRSLDQ